MSRITARTGTKRLPTQLPRTVYASVYMLLLLTVLTSLSVTIVPRLTVSALWPFLIALVHGVTSEDRVARLRR